jgi:hypothetical protein
MTTGRKHKERQCFVEALRKLDGRWGVSFHEDDFYDLHYSDLFTQMWQQGDRAVTRSEAYAMMRNVSIQTAKKYLNQAIENDYLLELDNPQDRRSKLVKMSPKLQERFERLIDESLKDFCTALKL